VGVYAGDGDVISTSAERRHEVLDAIHRSGVGLVRAAFHWQQIERDEAQPGVYDWTHYDELVRESAIQRVRLLPLLYDPPRWRSTRPASETGHRGMFPPKDFSDMAHWAAAVAARYGPGGAFWAAHPKIPYLPIRSWQIWNEPNIRWFWGRDFTDAPAYVKLLKAVGAAIRQVQPGAEIVTAGLAFSKKGPIAPKFLYAMYAAGAKGSFDTVAIHAYGRDAGTMLARIADVRQVMDDAGDPSPIWQGEFGWATGGNGERGLVVDPETQARMVSESLEALAAHREQLGLRGFVYFTWADGPRNPDPKKSNSYFGQMGLLTHDFVPKPALGAFTDAVRRIAAGQIDTSLKMVGSLRLNPRRFAPAPSGPTVVVPQPCPPDASCVIAGARLEFNSSAPVPVQVAVQRIRRGRAKTLDRVKVDTVGGSNRLRLSGRARGRVLEPGRYRLRVKTLGPLGRGAPQARTTFQIVLPPRVDEPVTTTR